MKGLAEKTLQFIIIFMQSFLRLKMHSCKLTLDFRFIPQWSAPRDIQDPMLFMWGRVSFVLCHIRFSLV